MCYICTTILRRGQLVKFKTMKTKRLFRLYLKNLPAMLWNFFKTNWFYVALSLMILGAILRKTIFSGASVQAQAQSPEKYTAARSGQEEGISLFGGIASGPKPEHRLPDIEAAVAEPFLRRFGKVTPGEQQKFGVPASVLLAAAYVNSYAGQRELAASANNYFALPCSGDWQGRSITQEGRCYRQYERAWDSFRDFSQLLKAQSWFAETRKSAGKDWKIWVKQLDGKGLSDVENFGAEMEKVIRAYRLFELDNQ